MGIYHCSTKLDHPGAILNVPLDGLLIIDNNTNRVLYDNHTKWEYVVASIRDHFEYAKMV